MAISSSASVSAPTTNNCGRLGTRRLIRNSTTPHFAFPAATGRCGDLTQETFTRFLEYRALDRVESDQHALAYLITTCRNLAIERNGRALQIPMEGLIELDSIPSHEQLREPVVDLERALLDLDEEGRTLAEWMREGLSVSEIARKLGISYTAAGVRIHRLKQRLRQALG